MSFFGSLWLRFKAVTLASLRSLVPKELKMAFVWS